MTDTQDAPSNLTHAGVTGKVPKRAKSRTVRKHGKGTPSQRHHVSQLKKGGVISDRAAAAAKI